MRVVLLRDSRWPPVPGVCCWRNGLRAAFAAAGASVDEVTWQAAAAAPPAPGDGQRPRTARLTSCLREQFARIDRGARLRCLWARARRLGRRVLPNQDAGMRGDLTGAQVVVAESLDAAMAAVDGGTPGPRLWALVLPADRLPAGVTSGAAAAVARAAGVVGGFLTDSEPARDEVERAASAARPRVRVFPPLAVDRRCPACAGAAAGPPADPLPEVAQLALWRTLIDQINQIGRTGSADSGAMSYSFPASRLRGPTARWVPAPRTNWGVEPAASPPPEPAPPEPAQGGHAEDRTGPPAWSAAAQDRAAGEILDLVTSKAPRQPRRRRTALVAGYDLKFARDLAERLGNRTDLDVTIDDWPELGQGTALTAARLRLADAVFAEWARTSAVWLSEHKRPDQFLAVRLHRFELDAPYPRQIAVDNVDAMVYIAPLFGRRIRDELGWTIEKLVYIPNYLDVEWLDRPKLPGARFTIGLVGIEWARKRFDLALDLLAALRREDRRFTLAVRSVMPWHNEYAWARPEERAYTTQCFNRITQDPFLRDGVVFEAPGRDMARWFRGIGHILSTSDEEGCHTSVAEGMASGAVPLVRPWPGAAEVYDKEWVHDSVDDAVAAVLDDADADAWAERAGRARAEIRRTNDPQAVVDAWADLLHGDIDGARRYFAEYSSLDN